MNLGEIFDLVNADFDPLTPQFNPAGPQDQASDDLADANVTALCLELPIALLTNNGANPIVGGWTSASLRQARLLDPTPTGPDGSDDVEGGPWSQVSRLGMPLVNEVVIGLSKKDTLQRLASRRTTRQFADFVTHPTLPELLEILFPGVAHRAERVPAHGPRGGVPDRRHGPEPAGGRRRQRDAAAQHRRSRRCRRAARTTSACSARTTPASPTAAAPATTSWTPRCAS